MRIERLCTSEWSTKAAAHPNSTAHCQDVCVTVWILLIQRGGRGGRIDTIENTTYRWGVSHAVYIFYFINDTWCWMSLKMIPDISLPDKLLRRRTWTCWALQHRYWQCEQTGPEWRGWIKSNYVMKTKKCTTDAVPSFIRVHPPLCLQASHCPEQESDPGL